MRPAPKDRQTLMRAATADVIAWQDHGDTRARARAVASVEPMVWRLARQHHRRTSHLGVDLEDLVAAGREGATIATNRFDRTRGAPFSVAAWPSINGHIIATARHGSGVVSINQGTRVRDMEFTLNRAVIEAENAGMSPNQALEHAATVAGISATDAVARLGNGASVSRCGRRRSPRKRRPCGRFWPTAAP